MNARPKKKLCWNCEGNVSVKAETCPFCGVSVVGLSEEISPGVPLAPYRLVNASESPVPLSPYLDEGDLSDNEDAQADEEMSDKEAHSDQNDDSKQVVLVLGLLLLGSIFFIFGFALLLFSDEGYLTLHWSAGYWFIYLLLALPMLFFGVRRLNTLSS